MVLRFAKETVFGTIPVTGSHTKLPMTGESLTYDIEKTSSEEMNTDRGVSDMIPTTASATGSVNVEMQASAYDPLIEAALQGAWAPSTGTFTITATATTLTSTAFPLTLVPGQFIGFAVAPGQPNYGKILRISSVADAVTATVLKIDPMTPSAVGTMTAAVLTTARLRNSSIRSSFSLEKEFSDLGVFRAYRGMNVSGMTINAAQGAITTGEFQFMGRDGMKKTAATQLPVTETVIPDTRPMSGMTGTACNIWIKDLPLAGTYLSSVSLTTDNNMRMQNAMCSADINGIAGAVGIGNGNFTATMSMEIYFANEDILYDEFTTNKNVPISFTAFDTEGYGYVFTFPKANITTHTVNASGNNQDVMATIEVTGLQTKGSAIASLNGAVLLVDRIKL